MLSLLEEAVLIGLRVQKDGSLDGVAELGDLLSSAVLVELALKRKIRAIDDDLKVVDATSTGDAILDEGLAKIQQGRAGMLSFLGIRYWTGFLRTSGIKDLSGRALTNLIDKGILRREEHRRLWLIPSQRYLMLDEKPRQDLLARINAIILDKAVPDPHTAGLICLISTTGLLQTLLPQVNPSTTTGQAGPISRTPNIDNETYQTVIAIQDALIAIIEEARKHFDG